MKPGDNLYFIGIGGARLSALAKIYLEKGYKVAGSDRRRTKTTIDLENRGIPVDYGHDPRKIHERIDVVIYTNAVGEDNPQLAAAREKGLRVLEGAELLGVLMREKEYGIAIAGTHGKTTTTAMTALILLKTGKDPTVVIGGDMREIPGNHRYGKSPYMVVEACEFRRSFLQLSPRTAIITNVDWDHPDCFPSEEDVVTTFREFISLIPDNGKLIIRKDDPHFTELSNASQARVVSFGLNSDADWYISNIKPSSQLGIEGDLFHKGSEKGRLRLRVPGKHNLLNALAALAAVDNLEIPLERTLAVLKEFRGVKRRFEIKGEIDGILVVDDYAHHPAAVSATLQTAKSHFQGKIWCVFQPHLFSRTRYLMDDFAKSFSYADELVLADIYPAREKDPGDISSKILAERTAEYHKNVKYIGEMPNITEYLLEQAAPGDLIITMGAGDIWKVGEEFLAEKSANINSNSREQAKVL